MTGRIPCKTFQIGEVVEICPFRFHYLSVCTASDMDTQGATNNVIAHFYNLVMNEFIFQMLI